MGHGDKEQTMTPGENLRRAIRFERPEWIPMEFHINGACWNHYPHDALQELMVAHPLLFPGYEPVERFEPEFSPVQLKDQPYTDPWGCVYQTLENGITGSVHQHPLADWAAFDTYEAPDPETTNGLVPIDWAAEANRLADAKADGGMAMAFLRHGHTFLQLMDIRGYENLMYDMVDEEPRLWKLIEMLKRFNLALIRRYIELGADFVAYPEDLGMQMGPMLSPDHFRKYIKPTYQRLMQPARDPLRSLIFSALNEPITDVYVDGRRVVGDGEVLTIDHRAAGLRLAEGQKRMIEKVPKNDWGGRSCDEIFPRCLPDGN